MSKIKAALPHGGLSFADIVREENLVQDRMHKETNNATVVGGSKMLQM